MTQPAGRAKVGHFREVKPKRKATTQISVDNTFLSIYSALTVANHLPSSRRQA